MKERDIPPLIKLALLSPQRLQTVRESGISETLFASSALADTQGEEAFKYGLREYLERAKVAVTRAQHRTQYPGRGVISHIEKLLDSPLDQVPIAKRLEVASMLGRHIMGLYAGVGLPEYNHVLVLGPGQHFGEPLNLRLHAPDKTISFIQEQYTKWLTESGQLLQTVTSESEAGEALGKMEKLDLMRGLANHTISGSFTLVDRLLTDIPQLSEVDLVIARHPYVINAPESLMGLAAWADRMQSLGGAYLFTHYTQDEMLRCDEALRSRGLQPLRGKNPHIFAGWYVEEDNANRDYVNICDGFVVTNIRNAFPTHARSRKGRVYRGR